MNSTPQQIANETRVNCILIAAGWMRHPASLHWLAPNENTYDAVNICRIKGLIGSSESALVSIGSDEIPATHRHKGRYDRANDAPSCCLAFNFTIKG